MNYERIIFVVLIIGIILFSGCTSLPGMPKIKVKDPATATTTTIKTVTDETIPACTKSGNECCMDKNSNGICDIDESTGETLETLPEVTTTTKRVTTTTILLTTSTTELITATSTTTTNSVTSTTQTQSGGKSCTTGSDCGEAYYGGCNCKGNDIILAKYIPACRNGTCIYLSKSDSVACRYVETNDKTKNSERCISGYSVCITQDDEEEFMSRPNDAQVFNNLSTAGFSKDYRGYRFKNSRFSYVLDNKCYDSLLFTVEVMKLNGQLVQADIAWNKTAVVDNLEFGVENIRRGDNMSVELSIWVVKT